MSKLAIIALDEGSMTAGTVANIVEVTADTAMGVILPLEQLSRDCGRYPVVIGDRWEDGVFSRSGVPLMPVPTENRTLFAEISPVKKRIIQIAACLHCHICLNRRRNKP